MGQFALQAVQRMVGVGHGDELDHAEVGAEVGNDQVADRQVGGALDQRFLDAGALPRSSNATAAALRHEGGRADDPRGG